ARDGEPEQVIDPADRGFALRELDVSLLPADERAEAVAAHAREAATAPFDLAAGPLVRGCLLHLDAHTHVLLLTQHHIIS
ncbi:condensation domain-containing protein, partial [Xanthomonas arboricola]|uniref:condensation domain-containing protein n=1 Tax=Xanthomonas arboricola TaxID=56448 RepID=UPI00129045C6